MSIQEDIEKAAVVGTAVSKIVDALIDLVGLEKAHEALDDAAVKRAEYEADLAEDLKFPKGGE